MTPGVVYAVIAALTAADLARLVTADRAAARKHQQAMTKAGQK